MWVFISINYNKTHKVGERLKRLVCKFRIKFIFMDFFGIKQKNLGIRNWLL